MALIHNDQVEEVGRYLLEGFLRLFRPGERLIEGKVDLIGRIDSASGDLGHGRAKGLKVIALGLIHQNVAIGKKQNALLSARLPQTPDDLKRCVCLASAGSHHKQYFWFACSDGFDSLVDGLQLVVAGRFATAIRVIVLIDDRQLSLGVTLPCEELVPKLAGAGEILQRDLGFQLGRIGLVMKYKAIAIAGKRERHIQQTGIIEPCCIPLPISCLLALASITASGKPIL